MTYGEPLEAGLCGWESQYHALLTAVVPIRPTIWLFSLRARCSQAPHTETKLKRPNPLPPYQMTATERRSELCGLLALGLVRLRAQQSSGLSDCSRDSSLHFPRDQSGHATPLHRRIA
jgi:hypothetical protein